MQSVGVQKNDLLRTSPLPIVIFEHINTTGELLFYWYEQPQFLNELRKKRGEAKGVNVN